LGPCVVFGFEPIKLRFIRIPQSLCDIDTQRLVKILDYHDKFIKFSLLRRMMETLELFTKEPMCRRAPCLKKKSK
jgi:hypothetical protein